jgi:modulator of FtsH protease HflK
MEQNTKRTGLTNLIVILLIAGAGAFLAWYSNTFAGQAGILFLGLGFLAAAVSYFQMRLEESERLEKLELDELDKSRGSSSLFAANESDVLPARGAREQFDRLIVPGFTVLLLMLQIGAVYWLWQWLGTATQVPIRQPAVAMSLFALFALMLFLLGKYSAGLARFEDSRLLRPGATYMLVGAYISFLIAASIAVVGMGFPRFDIYVARALTVLLALVAIETSLSLILEIYRPRVRGKQGRLLYDSRLLGLLAQPESLFTTAAHALDYQFGFKVSETWFYRFMERALAWLILLQLGVLIISTSFVFIRPGQEGLLERFGRPVTTTAALGPGLHMKLPWPIDRVHRFHTQQIQSFNIGFVTGEEGDQEKTVLWTVSHYQEEFNMLVASRTGRTPGAAEGGVPADLLTVSIPVQFQIRDLHAWAYNHTNGAQLLERLATREVVHYLVSVDINSIMSAGRSRAAQELQSRIQSKADQYNLGVRIVFVGLQDIHPPIKVAEDYQAVIAVGQENQAKLRNAEGYASRTVLMARAEAEKKLRDAEAYNIRTTADAQARASQFTHQMAAYQAAPEVFMQRAYLKALERGAVNARKYVLSTTNTQDVITLNLEDRLAPSLASDIDVPPARR